MEQEINKNINIDFENKVKQKNKKIFFNFMVRLIIVFITFSLCLIYLLTPLSSISNCVLNGNIYLQKEDIYELMNYEEPSKVSLYQIDEEKMENLLEHYPIIDDADIELTPFSMNVSFVESAPAAYYETDLYCSNGKVLDNESQNNLLIQDYLSKTSKYAAEFISKPIDGQYFNDYLYILTHLNKEHKVIDYIDTSNVEETLFLYYKESSNSYYYRVKLTYQPNYSLETYIKALAFNESMVEGFKKNIENNNKQLIEEENISYYTFELVVDGEKNVYRIY